MSGLTLPFVSIYIRSPKRRPPIVEKQNAISPSTTIPIVCADKKLSATAVAPTVTPRNIVTMFISSFCAVLQSLSHTPDSLNRLPSIRQPTSETASGMMSPTTIVTIIGKRIFAVFDTGRSWSITVILIFFVVKSFINGGWIIGISAI